MSTLTPQAENTQANIEEAKKFLLVTKLIHLAIVAGLVIFGGIVLFISSRQICSSPFFSNPIIILAVIICISTLGSLPVISFIYRKITPAPDSVYSALKKYQTFSIVKWAIIEGGALFSGVAILVTKNILPVFLFVISLAFLVCQYPSETKFISFTKDLQE